MEKLIVTPRGTVTIRPALRSDAARLRSLRLEALAKHPEAFASDAGTAAKVSVKDWEQRIASESADDRGIICVASCEDDLIGTMGLYRGNRPKTRLSGWLQGVYVRADWRGLGVSDALMEECLAWALAHHLAVVKLGVTTTNVSAIRCYVRSGFAIYGLEPKAIYHDDRFYDELLMARSI